MEFVVHGPTAPVQFLWRILFSRPPFTFPPSTFPPKAKKKKIFVFIQGIQPYGSERDSSLYFYQESNLVLHWISFLDSFSRRCAFALMAMVWRERRKRERPSGPNYSDTRSRHYHSVNSGGKSCINLGWLIVRFQFRLSLRGIKMGRGTDKLVWSPVIDMFNRGQLFFRLHNLPKIGIYNN